MRRFILITFFVILFIVGCQKQAVSKEIKTSTQLQLIDCGTDTECFSANFLDCKPAKMFGGATEIRGGTPKSCSVMFQSMDDPQYTGGKRLTMDCTIKNTDTFKDEEMNGYMVVVKGAACKGDLYDFYAKLANP